ncbi:MAG: AmmeMemoRadiSam system protein B [Thermodesulfobacteriota bacterium]|nr:AmmeMemoRadiSam system protein B [Thermodesulfobacteriota bacterium]
MNKLSPISQAFICFLLFALAHYPAQAGGEEKGLEGRRPSVLAGTWYPGTRGFLSRTVQGFLSEAGTTRLEGALRAVIVPHAGYRYSGRVAAHAYRLLEKRQFARVVLVGPSHRVSFKGVSVNLQSGYETPLGVVPVDRRMGRNIVKAGPNIRWLKQAHANEHSLEIQLPFLQTTLKDFRIVPILMGQRDYNTCLNLANTLLQVLGDAEETLLLASSDLSHYHSSNKAKVLDLEFIKHVRSLDPKGLAGDIISGKCEACGAGPVVTILLAARAMGANQTVILDYADSGDVTGDHSSVVGYLSAALVKSSDTGPHPR